MMLDIACFIVYSAFCIGFLYLYRENSMAKKKNKNKLYVYRDYVALCYARDVYEAIAKFKCVYDDVDESNVYKVWFTPFKVAVLHDVEGR